MCKTPLIKQFLNANLEFNVGIQEFLIVQNELGFEPNQLVPRKNSLKNFLISYNKVIKEHLFYKKRSELKVEFFSEIPILQKKDFQKLDTEIHASYMGQIWEKSTSGTSGKPLQTYFDTFFHLSLKYTSLYKLCNKLSLFDLETISNRVITLGLTDNFAYEMIADICPFTNTNFFVQRTININDKKTIQNSIEFINIYEPLIIRSKPYLLSLLADYLATNKIKLRYKPILVSSGCEINNTIWEKCESVFRSKLINLYGSTEIGIMAYQERLNSNFKLLEEDLIVEVITDNGKPSPLNCEGNIVVSSLRNKLLPIFRYQIGDRGIKNVETSNFPKIKGRNLPLFIGRSDELIPSYQIANLLNKSYISDYRITQNKKGELELIFIDSQILNSDIKQELERGLNLDIRVIDNKLGRVPENRFNSYVNE